MIRLGPEQRRGSRSTPGRAGAAPRPATTSTIEVTRWQATLADDAVDADRRPRSLRVEGGSGGITPLGDDEKRRDRADDRRRGAQGRHDRVPLQPRHAARRRPRRRGRARPARRHAGRSRSRSTSTTATSPAAPRSSRPTGASSPYSALFGTLKVADVVEVAIDATLPKEPTMVELDHTLRDRQAHRLQLGRDPRPRPRSSRASRAARCSSARAREQAKAEIKVKMGAMSMTFKGTVEVARARRGGAHAPCCGSSRGHRRIGLRERRRHVRARRRRRHDPHRGADQRQGRVDGRGRRAARCSTR